MGTVRFFGGSRYGGKRSPAGELMRFELQKKGKLPAADRYRRMLKQKLAENRSEVKLPRGFALPGTIQQARGMSKRAENALKEINARKAAKEAKVMRNMVIVQPRTFQNGSINKKGQIFDVAGNMVATVNTKNGKIATTMGWGLGKYKAKSHSTNMAITDAINKFSPYFINLRKLQAMQQGNVGTGQYSSEGDVAIYTPSSGASASAADRPKAGAGMTAMRPQAGAPTWGTRSDNVWGTTGNNVWGTSSDDVWGSGGGFDAVIRFAESIAAFFGLKR